MKFKIVGIDLAEDEKRKLKCMEIHHKYEFYECSLNEKYTFSKIQAIAVVIDLKDDQERKYQLCSKLSKMENVFVIFIAESLSMEERKLWSLLGAIIFIKRPFYIEELITRVSAICNGFNGRYIGVDNLFVDLKKRKVHYNGNVIKTTPKVYDMILFFIENDGKVVNRFEIMEGVFGTEYITEKNIDTYIKKIRKLTTQNIIYTIYGNGYMYNSEVLQNKGE